MDGQFLPLFFLFLSTLFFYAPQLKRKQALLSAEERIQFFREEKLPSYSGSSSGQTEEDVKIADFSSSAAVEIDPSEDEIALYFRHKHNGNIQTAKRIGEKLAEKIIHYHLEEKEPAFPDWNKESIFWEEQAKMMYLYTAETAAKQYSPDSILCQMVIASMGDAVSERMPSFYRKMEECRAYTMYKLCGSRKDGVDRYMGEAYAQMVGHKEEETAITFGSELYHEMATSCNDLFRSEPYVAIREKPAS